MPYHPKRVESRNNVPWPFRFPRRKRSVILILACGAALCFDVFLLTFWRAGTQDVMVKSHNVPESSPNRLANVTAPLLPGRMSSETVLLPPTPSTNIDTTFQEEPSLPSQNLVTAILPITFETSLPLKNKIMTLLETSLHLHEVLLLCRPEDQARTREVLLSLFSVQMSGHHADVSLVSWPAQMEEGAATLWAAQHVDSPVDRILLLDTDGLEPFDSQTRAMLAGRFATPLPVGPRGFEIQDDETVCLPADDKPGAASFLVPPFSVAPLLIPPHDLQSDSVFDIWASLGKHISRARYERVGGVVVDYNEDTSYWCSSGGAIQNLETIDVLPPVTSQSHSGGGSAFAVILSTLDDLFNFATPVCHFRSEGYDLHILLTGTGERERAIGNSGQSVHINSACAVQVDLLSEKHVTEHQPDLEEWIGSISPAPNVVIAVQHTGLSSSKWESSLSKPVVIQIPREDLPFCDWMTSLPNEAWQNWHKPRLDVSVITNDRPDSLSRLLKSLSNASFFGDTVDLRINVEQTADEETLDIVNGYQWRHGSKFVHRRVIQGGLLPAVVESWYPASNDSYGVMLEDDVELSPLFYAWIKMSILFYRYGKPENASPQLFGISLYQQKNLELRPEGRHLFSAQTVFASASYPDVNTPYLSQIPCSWGAVYFPEQWREFHNYLAVRLSQTHPNLPLDKIVAPGLRSNKWTRSWKKYFIELVYMRGYVMLYPNFRDYISLSTNHLEVGSHVKEMSPKAYERKKELYLLPLMQRPPTDTPAENDDLTQRKPTTPAATDLMDLPEGRLPSWTQLPVLDLLGLFATATSIQQRGIARREELFECERADAPLDVRALLCLPDHAEEKTVAAVEV